MRSRLLLSVAAVAALAACGKTDTTPVDSALSIGGATLPLDSLSAAERNAYAPAPIGVSPAVSSGGSSVRTSTAPRRSSGTANSSGSSGSRSTVSSAPAPTRTTIQKNTKRDAAIGAAAGAVIGATTSRDKVKGAVVGGVVGAVVGGVIGNNVDVKQKKQ